MAPPRAPDGPGEREAEDRLLGAAWAESLGVEDVAPWRSYWQDFSFVESLEHARRAGLSVPAEHVTRNRTVATLAASLAAERSATVPGS